MNRIQGLPEGDIEILKSISENNQLTSTLLPIKTVGVQVKSRDLLSSGKQPHMCLVSCKTIFIRKWMHSYMLTLNH